MNQGMLNGALIGAVIGCVIVGLMLLIAFKRRGNIKIHRLGDRRREVQAAAAPAEVFERLKAIGPPFRVDDSDGPQRRLVLSTQPSLASFGFFYPVVIQPRPDGGSTIHIGIESKLFQYGMIVTRWHKKAEQAITEQVTVPSARLVG